MEKCKNNKLEGKEPPGFFIGCPETEFHVEMREKIADKIEKLC